MRQDIESDHFELTKNVNQDMKDVDIEAFPQPCSEIGKCSFTRDVLGESGIIPIRRSPLLIPNDFEKLTHVLKAINIPKQIGQKDTRGIVAWRSLN
ncbi:MAG: hypothetical protein H8E10_02020 [Desulfobacterales bacterium]|nr:hypothetical protein [Desulfobacterales bacterium]